MLYFYPTLHGASGTKTISPRGLKKYSDSVDSDSEFHSKPPDICWDISVWASENFDLLVALDQIPGITSVIIIYPLHTMNI